MKWCSGKSRLDYTKNVRARHCLASILGPVVGAPRVALLGYCDWAQGRTQDTTATMRKLDHPSCLKRRIAGYKLEKWLTKRRAAPSRVQGIRST